MKKFLSVLICFVMLFCITACGSQSVQETTSSSTSSSTSTSKPQVKYYKGTRIPTLDSVLDAELLPDISEEKEGSYYYGGFTDNEDLKASMLIYAEYVKDTCGYTYEIVSSNNAAIGISTEKGHMIVMGANLSGTGLVISILLPD